MCFVCCDLDGHYSLMSHSASLAADKGLVAAIAINVIEPTFESQTKIKLGSLTMAPEKDSEGNPYPFSGISNTYLRWLRTIPAYRLLAWAHHSA